MALELSLRSERMADTAARILGHRAALTGGMNSSLRAARTRAGALSKGFGRGQSCSPKRRSG
eukprot:9229760-Pyramimonas_sp.AAC.1